MKLVIRHKGGAGSGFHGHAGRPGRIGGSQAEGKDWASAKLDDGVHDTKISYIVESTARNSKATSKSSVSVPTTVHIKDGNVAKVEWASLDAITAIVGKHGRKVQKVEHPSMDSILEQMKKQAVGFEEYVAGDTYSGRADRF